MDWFLYDREPRQKELNKMKMWHPPFHNADNCEQVL